jgi:hypothetical protein
VWRRRSPPEFDKKTQVFLRDRTIQVRENSGTDG